MSISWRPDRKKWEVSVMVRGKRRRIHCDTKREAEQLALNARLKNLEFPGMNSSYSIAEAFSSFLATDSAQKVPKAQKADKRFLTLVQYFLESIREKTYVQQVTLEDLQLLQLWLAEARAIPVQKEVWTQTTIAHSCKLLKSVFKKLMRMDLISKNPCEFWTIPAGEHKMGRPMSAAEFEKLLTVVPSWYVPILRVLRLTGVRGASLASLTWDQVDFANQRVLFTTRKGGLKKTKVIPIPMFPELRALFESIWSGYQWTCVAGAFPGTNLHLHPVFMDEHNHAVTAQMISTIGSKCIRKAGITGTTIYGLRRALATDLMDAGADTKTISKLMGHASEKQLDRYTGYASLAPLEHALNLVRGESPTPPTDDYSKLDNQKNKKD